MEKLHILDVKGKCTSRKNTCKAEILKLNNGVADQFVVAKVHGKFSES